MQNLKRGLQSDVLIMDFSKAFDKVGHRHLAEKLDFYGIHGKTKQWITDFLANRIQTVVVDGECSYTASVQSGLFYINDIADSLNAKVRLFADDTIAYLAVVTDEDARSLQNDLTKLGEWEQKWHMEFHPDKCQVITISESAIQ